MRHVSVFVVAVAVAACGCGRPDGTAPAEPGVKKEVTKGPHGEEVVTARVAE